jgi:hypothetical protein
MRIDRAQYGAWQQLWSEINDIVTDRNDDWVTAVLDFMHQIESARHDAYVTGLARAARQRASELRKPKGNNAEAYRNFLNAWVRVEGGIGMHLIER